MKFKVIKKHKNGKHCFVCGTENEYGLVTYFYELENKSIVGIFKPKDFHQSYPGRLHGGISASVLDETIGRAINIDEPEVWGVTVDLKLRYKKPVPLDCELKVVGRITKNTKRIFEGTGEIILPNGDIAVVAEGRYMKLPLNKISNGDYDMNEEMFLVENENEPAEFDI